MDLSETEPKPVDRVALACVQCRSRHVKCDASQPVCKRCKRDGKECTYKKSRRGGLDKASLAKRRLALQQQAQNDQQVENVANNASSTESRSSQSESFNELALLDCTIVPTVHPFSAQYIAPEPATSNDMVFQINTDRLLDFYYDNFHISTPIALPRHFLDLRRERPKHGLDAILKVMHWIGSLYAPWTPSEAYYDVAKATLSDPTTPSTAFTVQALTLFALGQYHCGSRTESRQILDASISIAVSLGMNTKEFAEMHGEGNPVLEESWRRTYYFLHLVDQHFAVASSKPQFTLRDIENLVDLPCEDMYYESGNIPRPTTWEEYEKREFADEEVVYSSFVYLIDVASIISWIMRAFLESGTISDRLIASSEMKLAVWHSLLPACKRDPLRPDGTIDELMFLAHSISTIIMLNMHRPFSSLTYGVEELSTTSFITPVPFVESLRSGRAAHTARALKASDMLTKLLSIPCKLEQHHLFVLCIVASTATAQVSACKILLDDHALSIARDRVRLSIGALNTIGTIWPLAKTMAKEVKWIARKALGGETSLPPPSKPLDEVIDLPRDDIVWPVNPLIDIDIYSGIEIPMDWSTMNINFGPLGYT